MPYFWWDEMKEVDLQHERIGNDNVIETEN